MSEFSIDHSRIEYANLSVDARESDIRLLCLQANNDSVPVILVNPNNIALAINFIGSSNLKVDSVLSYPIGAYPPEVKAFEVADAFKKGADRITMLLTVSAIIERNRDHLQSEISLMTQSAGDKPARVMIEMKALTKEDQCWIIELIKGAGLHEVVISTGFDRNKFDPILPRDVMELNEICDGSVGIVAIHPAMNRHLAESFLNFGASKAIVNVY